MAESKMPAKIRVAQDADGFWTCREAVSGSPEFIRADIVERMAEALADISTYCHHPWSAHIASAAITSYREAAGD